MFLEKFIEYFPIIEMFTYILFDKRLKQRIKNFETIIFLHTFENEFCPSFNTHCCRATVAPHIVETSN